MRNKNYALPSNGNDNSSSTQGAWYADAVPSSQRIHLWTLAEDCLEPLCSRPDDSFPGLAFPPDYVVGRSDRVQSLYREMQPLVRCDLPVIVSGETGVGKEHVARILHESSERRDGPFVAINCAAIPSDLLEAEMFGIGKGVATGVSERMGKFELANGGSLFLDEISEMSPALQAKLLRTLQEKEIQPLGRKAMAIDVRIIAATNADLESCIDEGTFRRDLFYRLAGYVLRVPSLRDRQEDMPLLINEMLRTYSREQSKRVAGITAKALDLLMNYSWPGNVREMQHEIQRLVLVCEDGRPIEATILAPHIRDSEKMRPVTSYSSDNSSLNLEEHVRRVESEIVQLALTRAKGNQSEAARLLGISRNGLATKIKRLGIEG